MPEKDLAPVVPTELPQLPLSPYLFTEWVSDIERKSQTMYTADQMRAYARAALAAAPQQGWQPIKTAPKGATVLLTDGHEQVVGHELVAPGLWGVFVPGTPMLFQPHLQFKPTHWMPLPEPPGIKQQASDEGGGGG